MKQSSPPQHPLQHRPLDSVFEIRQRHRGLYQPIQRTTLLPSLPMLTTLPPPVSGTTREWFDMSIIGQS